MNTSDPALVLLHQLSTGDAAAAQRVFADYEPYLRMVVRRQLTPPLRAKFDSTDIVQSVWTDVLAGFRKGGWRFTDADHLRAFLVKVTRNRFIDRVRQHRNALEHEMPVGATEVEQLPSSLQARPSEVAQADDLWQQMLALCPPAHHELLRLKRDGRSLDEIAAHTVKFRETFHPMSGALYDQRLYNSLE